MSRPAAEVGASPARVALGCLRVLRVVFCASLLSAAPMCFASFDGLIVSAKPQQSPVIVGSILYVDVVVKNTGSSAWDLFRSPNWITSSRSFSWPTFVTAVDDFHHEAVEPGATATGVAWIDAEAMPTTPGDYWFLLHCFRPASEFGDGNYLRMSNSPFLVRFTVIAKSAESAGLQLLNPVRSGSSFGVSVQTETGKDYALEYKAAWNSSTWTRLPAVAGDGTLKKFTDSGAPAAQQRFYRIVVLP